MREKVVDIKIVIVNPKIYLKAEQQYLTKSIGSLSQIQIFL